MRATSLIRQTDGEACNLIEDQRVTSRSIHLTNKTGQKMKVVRLGKKVTRESLKPSVDNTTKTLVAT